MITDLVLAGPEYASWSVCHRDDVARAFVNAAYNPIAFGKSYHTTGEEWLTWDMCIRRAAEAINTPSPDIVHIPTDILGQVAPKIGFTIVTNFQYNNIFDCTAARTDLGFRYTITWEEGVRRMAIWTDENSCNENSDEDTFEDRLVTDWKKLGAQMIDHFNEDG